MRRIWRGMLVVRAIGRRRRLMMMMMLMGFRGMGYGSGRMSSGGLSGGVCQRAEMIPGRERAAAGQSLEQDTDVNARGGH